MTLVSNLAGVSRGGHLLSLGAIFVVGFVAVLALAIAGALVRLNWRCWLPAAEKRDSLVASLTTTVCSFMSFLP